MTMNRQAIVKLIDIILQRMMLCLRLNNRLNFNPDLGLLFSYLDTISERDRRTSDKQADRRTDYCCNNVKIYADL